ncbi:phage baseplate assembly protein V [uncultured Herbaspirillum sp.]|uniref:phage baseplate assembly protein V n=1 Tax=uncultured Herbaspirillum sp. TaxID=160236 RepID=UPI002609FB0B|nr:phage baseplate assembly protein V [uncultured Herbaspirillum sp.]
MIDELRRLLSPLERKIRLLASRAVLTVRSSNALMQVKALEGEPRDKVELFQQYGFRSAPQAGAEGILIALGGVRDAAVVLCMDDRRVAITMQAGEVAMYTDEGDSIHMKRGRIVEVTTETFVLNASKKVILNSPEVKSTGTITDLSLGNSVTVDQLRQHQIAHTHHVNGTNAESNPPTQVLS